MHLREALLQASKIGYTHCKKLGAVYDPKRILDLVKDKEVKADLRKWAFRRIGPAQELAVVLGNTSEFYAVMAPEPAVPAVSKKYR